MSLIDEGIIQDFVAESREHLNNIEPDLLAMEQSGGEATKEVINKVFRAIHSIKGGAGFLAFENLKNLSHVMEGVLMLVRDGKLKLNHEHMDAIFGAVDRLRAMLDDIKLSDNVPCEAETARLRAILEGKGGQPDATVQGKTKDQVFDLYADEVKSALLHGQSIYRVVAFLHKDVKDQGMTPLAFLNNALTVGQVLDAFIDLNMALELEHAFEQDLALTLLFATVLEPDLTALALKIPGQQIELLDLSDLKAQLKEKKKKKAPTAEKPEAPKAPPTEVISKPSAGASLPHESESVSSGKPLSQPVSDGEASPTSSTATSGAGETLRVRVDLLTSLMNLAGELVLGRNQLMRAWSEHSRDVPGLGAILQDVDHVTTDLQEGIMQTRMQPIGTIFSRFPRLIRDLSRQLGKQIEVELRGSEVELDKSIVELLVDPLTHLVRNCADHALEKPEERKATGKEPTGHVILHAYHEGGQVNIAISDDGRGIDAQKVLKRALEKGVITKTQAEGMTERDLVNLIFAPGFSTAEKVTDVSGRGVGMDVVKTNVEKLGGHVEVHTELGKGTTVRLRLPLTLAIIPSMIVGVEGSRFAIPQVNVVEFVWVKATEVGSRIERVQGAYVLRLRDQLLPLIRLAEVLDMERTFIHPETGERISDRRSRIGDRRGDEPFSKIETLTLDEIGDRTEDRRQDWRSDYNIVVLRVGSNQFGVIVDELFDIEEIVVKPLSNFIQGCKCFSGATILGDGRVIMILDAGGLVAKANLHFSDLQNEEKHRRAEMQRQAALNASRRRSIILFNAARDEFFAVPQETVLRLEKVLPGQIERVGEKEFINYRGQGLPLLRLDRHMEVRPLPDDLEELYIIIPKLQTARAPAGILISSILDAMDVEVDLKNVGIQGAGLEGEAIVNGKLTLFLEPEALLRQAEGGRS